MRALILAAALVVAATGAEARSAYSPVSTKTYYLDLNPFERKTLMDWRRQQAARRGTSNYSQSKYLTGEEYEAILAARQKQAYQHRAPARRAPQPVQRRSYNTGPIPAIPAPGRPVPPECGPLCWWLLGINRGPTVARCENFNDGANREWTEWMLGGFQGDPPPYTAPRRDYDFVAQFHQQEHDPQCGDER